MPLVRVEVLKGRSTSERKQLLDAVHDALVEAFGIPEDDRTQRLIEHDPDNLETEPGCSERYTLVEITAFPGRSPDAKRALHAAIVRNLEAVGTPANDVLVVLHEPPCRTGGSEVVDRGTRSSSITDSMSEREGRSLSALEPRSAPTAGSSGSDDAWDDPTDRLTERYAQEARADRSWAAMSS